MRPLRLTPALLVLGLAAPGAPHRAALASDEDFDRRELVIPMRDGVTLFAVALVPKRAALPLPIILVRTPYGAANAFRTAELPTPYRELAEDGYVFVTEDVRGRHGSGGQFVMNGALHDPRDPTGVDEATDTWDTVDWLVKHLPRNNGRAGVMGVSYPGWLAGMAGVHPHPAVKAISPQAPMTDTWLGDDFFHQGAFRQSFGVEYASRMELTRDSHRSVPIGRYDHFDWYYEFPTLDSLARAAGIMSLPSWTGFRMHPAWDAYWQAKAMQRVLTRPDVPILLVGGFWDQEDMFGPQEAYRVLEARDAKGLDHIVLGPWSHGQWSFPGGDSLGMIRFDAPTADWFREHVQRPWFAHWLWGIGDGRFPEAWVFESGENAWHTFDAWPPREATPAKLYLRDRGRLSFEGPEAAGVRGSGIGDRGTTRPEAVPDPRTPTPESRQFDSYVSDPAHPIPYMPRPIDGTRWREWLVQDQRFVDGRPDVLTWQTEPLAADVTIAGNVVAHLFASTTGTDADWVVKLIDVYPDSIPRPANPRLGGYELMVAADIMRGRYYRGWSTPTPIPAGTVTPFDVDLHQQLYRFRRGHRIMVQVQSTWFPLYDRNPQTFVPNIFEARPSDFHAREHRVWHTARWPSHVAVSVLP